MAKKHNHTGNHTPSVHTSDSYSRASRFGQLLMGLAVVLLVSVIGYHYLRGSHAATAPHVLWGSWVKGGVNLSNPDGSKTNFSSNQSTAFSQQINRVGQLKVIHRYGHFPGTDGPGQDVNGIRDTVNSDIAAGHLTLYNLSNGTDKNDWAETAAGNYDQYLINLAQATDQINGTLYLNWMHEPTTQNNAAGSSAQLQQDFRNGFKHFHDVIVNHKHKQNVVFVVILTEENIDSGKGDAFFPGNQYVDILGIDGYNWACTIHNGNNNLNKPGCSNNGWRSFCSIFDQGDAFANSKGINWWVTEMGLGEDPNKPTLKGQWFSDMQQFIESHQAAGGAQGSCPTAAAGKQSWSGLTGIVYYQGGMNIDGFNIGSSAASLSAYKAISNDPFFGGSSGPQTDNPPTISGMSPGNNATVYVSQGTVAVSANVSDTDTTPVKNVTYAYKPASGSSWTTIGTANGSVNWTLTGLAAGSYNLRAIATDTGGKQSAAYTVTVNVSSSTPPGGQADLVVTSVSMAPAPPAVNQQVTFTAVIKNQGTAAIAAGTKFGLGFYLDGTEVSWNAGFSNGLAAGATATLAANGGPGGVTTWKATAGDHSIQAWADDTNKIPESNDNNNKLAVSFNVPTPPTPQTPQPPQNVRSTGQTINSINLTWDASVDQDTPAAQLVYHIKRNGTEVGHTTAGTITYTDGGLAPNTTYSYQVFAVDPQNHISQLSTAFTQATKSLNCATPAAPGNFKAVAQADATSVALTWNAVSVPAPCAIDHYVVQKGTSTVTTLPGTSFTVTGLTPNTKYTFTVLAVTNDNHPGASSSASATTPTKTDSTPPTAPANVVATPVSTTQINITWDAASDPETSIKTYHILRDGNEIGQTTNTSFGDSGLQPSTDYTYVIVAENGATPSLKTSSLPATATTLDLPIDNGGGSGDGSGGGTSDYPSLDDTTSVGTGDDSGNSSDQYSYDPNSGNVSDNPSAASTTPTAGSTNSSASTTQSKPKIATPVRLIAGIGGLGLLIGAPLAVGLFLRRLPVRGLSPETGVIPDPTTISSPPGQLVSPTQKPEEDEDNDRS